jgi:predicted outer membrane protein
VNVPIIRFVAAVALATFAACDTKKDAVTSGREAVKEVVTQPFNTLDSAKQSLQKSEDKSKAAIAEMEKEFKQP